MDSSNFLAQINEACSELNEGELIIDPSLTLWDILSATQIDEPRMDSGTAPSKVMTVTNPRFSDASKRHEHSSTSKENVEFNPLRLWSLEELLWMIDRLIVCEMAFHSGEALYTTVFICHYVFRLRDISVPALKERYQEQDPKTDERIMLLGIVFRSYLAAFIRCVGLAFVEMSKGKIYDIEDWHASDSGVRFDELDPIVHDPSHPNEEAIEREQRVVRALSQNLDTALEWLEQRLKEKSGTDTFLLLQLKSRLGLRKQLLSLFYFASQPQRSLPNSFVASLSLARSCLTSNIYSPEYSGSRPSNWTSADIDPPRSLDGTAEVFDPLLCRLLPTQNAPRKCNVLTQTIPQAYVTLQKLLDGFENLQALWLSANLRHVFLGRLGPTAKDSIVVREGISYRSADVDFANKASPSVTGNQDREVGWAEWFSYFQVSSWREHPALAFIRSTQLSFLDSDGSFLGTLSKVDLLELLLVDFTGLHLRTLLSEFYMEHWSETVDSIIKDLADLAVIYLGNMCHNRPRQRRKYINDVPGLANILELTSRLPSVIVQDVRRMGYGLHPTAISLLQLIPTTVSLVDVTVCTEIVLSGFELDLYGPSELRSNFWAASHLLQIKAAYLDTLLAETARLSSSPHTNFLRYRKQLTTFLQLMTKAAFSITFLLSEYDAPLTQRGQDIFHRRFKWASAYKETTNHFNVSSAWELYQKAAQKEKSRKREEVRDQAIADIESCLAICDQIAILSPQETCTVILHPSEQGTLLQRLRNSCLINLNRLRRLPDDRSYKPAAYTGPFHPWFPILV
ncbi:hypothetical protein BT69DRAFT_952168 [Atractiella rhizophila]|nr:hypothetical protein BT69DRAFT_952168 [Atractiella rhizophila]